MTPGQIAWRTKKAAKDAANGVITEMRFFEGLVIGAPGECWLWRGPINCDGYGSSIGRSAHRAAYSLFVGAIPEGLTIDHTCHNRDLLCPGSIRCLHRRCVNPAHLEAVTKGENCRRARTPGRPRAWQYWRRPLKTEDLARSLGIPVTQLRPELVRAS